MVSPESVKGNASNFFFFLTQRETPYLKPKKQTWHVVPCAPAKVRIQATPYFPKN